MSDDGMLVAFTERDWGQLTYLVVVDRRRRRRTQTTFHGSFPVVHAGQVVFVSDPRFVVSADSSFQQIERFSIYAYEVAKGTLCRIAHYPSNALPYSAR